MVWLILFIFGIAIGSFLNVVALRYDGDHFVFNPKEIGGRSHCPYCKKTLRWFELIPLVSFALQGGRCRRCHAKIGWQYPLVELLSGLIFVFIPLFFSSSLSFSVTPLPVVQTILWVIAFELFLLIAYIDIRLQIIPDELNIALTVIALAVVASGSGGMTAASNVSFFGSYAAIFGLQSNVWLNHGFAALLGILLFGAIVAATRGRGMGIGDVKLAFPLGLLFGWPDILIIAMMAFIIGGAYGVVVVLRGEKTLKSAVPFGPFLVIAGVIAFFAGSLLFNWYFHMLGL